ncbi:MAG: energy transducer TonB [Acetobacteraceae bacterium]|nr:energy transducer TonB [Acetobacteraceae bacterium]
MPRFRRPPRPPDYPPRAIELDITGTVVVRALLTPEGDPQQARVHRSSGHTMLDAAALAAVRRWAFEPASRDGRRIAAWVEVPVHFRLQ